MKINDIMKLNDTQFEQQLALFDNIPNSRVLSSKEERDLKVRIAELEHTLKKCSNGKIVSAGLQPIVSEFEDNNYDLDKIDPKINASLHNTYDQFMYCMENDPKTFKNSSVKLYCELYEMFHLKKAADVVNKVKSSKFLKSNNLSKEDFSIKGLENYLATDPDVFSTEGIFSNFFTKLLNKSKVPDASNAVQFGVFVVTILLILLTISVVVLCIINAQFNAELVKILDKLSDEEVKEKGSLKCRQDNVIAAAKNMEINTPSITKNTIFKAAKYSVRQVNKFSKVNFAALDKSVEEFNNECNDMVARSTESGVAAESIGINLLSMFKNFTVKHKTTISVIMGIAAFISFSVIGIRLLRSAIYHFKYLNIRLGDFFKEQVTLTTTNVESLIDDINDPSISESEYKRISKIITKQKAWIKTMTSWSNYFYKSQVDAGTNVMRELRQDDQIDFEKIVDERDQVEEAAYDEISEKTDSIQMQQPNKPVVLF